MLTSIGNQVSSYQESSLCPFQSQYWERCVPLLVSLCCATVFGGQRPDFTGSLWVDQIDRISSLRKYDTTHTYIYI